MTDPADPPEVLILLATEHTELLMAEPEQSLIFTTQEAGTEIIEQVEEFHILEVAEQGVPGPTGAPGKTIFAPIADAALSGIATRLDLIDQFALTVSGEGEDPDFLNLYLST